MGTDCTRMLLGPMTHHLLALIVLVNTLYYCGMHVCDAWLRETIKQQVSTSQVSLEVAETATLAIISIIMARPLSSCNKIFRRLVVRWHTPYICHNQQHLPPTQPTL